MLNYWRCPHCLEELERPFTREHKYGATRQRLVGNGGKLKTPWQQTLPAVTTLAPPSALYECCSWGFLKAVLTYGLYSYRSKG